MTEHAKLSASGAHRWMSCPGSVKAEENIPEQSNKYADEGTLAHELAANKLLKRVKNLPTNYAYYDDMIREGANKYVEYVEILLQEEFFEYEMRHSFDECEMERFNNTFYIEKKVDFSNIVPDGFGTADCIIKTQNYVECGNTLHIIDFKYGLNPIYAKDNMQLLLYALGAINLPGNDPNEIYIHIVQPRISNYSVWKISFFELVSWVKYINDRALEALKDDAPRIPSKEACKWCKARFSCYALNNVTKNVIGFSDKKDMTDDNIRYVLDNAKLVKSFISSLEQKIYEQIESGVEFEGYKLIEGRSTRKLKEDIEEKLVALLGEKAYSKSIINITQLDKLLTKDEVNSLVYLSKGKPRLVKHNDINESIEFDSLIFDDIE